MSLYICSLANNQPRPIPSRKWTLVRYPYTTPPTSYDPWEMHRPSQPDGLTSVYPDKYSALIWPTAHGWGTVEGHVEIESGDYTEIRTMFARDPYGVNDQTNDEHHAASPGMQFFTVLHRLWLHPDVPIGFMVYQNGPDPVNLVYTQFKLDVETDVAVPE